MLFRGRISSLLLLIQSCFLLCLTWVPTSSLGTSSRRRVSMPLYKPKVLKTKDGQIETFKTYYLPVPIDHFGFANENTYQMRYLIADQYWNRNGGPIFFYTGNEGDIELFCNNTGFMWDIAPDFKAMLVFAEHRYYGKSMPFGKDSYKNSSTLNYLTSEQALADFATLIRYLKTTIPGTSNSQVVTFGGSYGGMLSAWMRIKYPNMVTGALAASAPVWQFHNITPCNAFYDTTSATWAKASPTCGANLHKSYQALRDATAQASGFAFVSSTFHLCSPLATQDDLSAFINFLQDTYVNYAMVDYPYPANFLSNLPGWPVTAACSFLSQPLSGKDLLVGLSKVINLYFNYTGDASCIDWKGSSGGSLGYQGWDYQSCTEMVMPMCSDGSGIFDKIAWDFNAYRENCMREFKVQPREDWVQMEYWGKALKSASNIIFSNGLLDPWSSGGVLTSQSDSIIAILIRDGAHHYDLRGANSLDTPYVKNARVQETNILRRWLNLTP